jgi:hypothetical protein
VTGGLLINGDVAAHLANVVAVVRFDGPDLGGFPSLHFLWIVNISIEVCFQTAG